MQLRLSVGPLGKVLRNVEYTPGRDTDLSYSVQLNAVDYPLGTTLAAASLILAPDFGLAPVLVKQITPTASVNGQITDTGADGVGAFYIAIGSAELLPYSQAPLAYEVVVTDSRGKQATIDAGALVPTPSTAGKPVDHITLTPATFALAFPGTQPMTATAYDEDGNVLIGRTIIWSSSDPLTGAIDTNGVVTVLQPGSVIFTASIEGHAATATGTLTVPVDHVVVAPATFEIAEGQTQQLTATVYDVANDVLVGRTVVWTSSDPAHASVDSNGLVTALIGGVSATITATCEGKAGTSLGTIDLAFPVTPAQLKSQYNALGGATMRQIYIRGTSQTIAGGKCTSWDDAVNPSQGMHWRPSADVNSGTGAAVGGSSGTSIIDAGLELPASALDTLIALVQSDPSVYTINPTAGAPAGNVVSQTIYDLFADHSKGLTIGGAVRMLTNTKTLSFESAGHTDDIYFAPDFFSQWVTLADPLAAVGGATVYDTGSARFRIGWFLTDTPNASGRGYSWSFQQFGRDLLRKGKTMNPHPLIGVTGRRLRLGVDNGNPIGHGCEYNLIYFSTGRENKAQNKLISDYIKSKWPDMWEDPRTRLGINLGDSWQEGLDYPLPGGFAPLDIGIAHDIQLGHTARNLARLSDCAFFTLAYSGDTIAQMQYGMYQLVKDLDFSTRSRVALLASEFLNGSNVAQNYFLADKLRASDAKIHVVLYDITYSSDTTLSNFPTYNDDLDAHYNSLGADGLPHADALLHVVRGPTSGLNTPWRSRNFGNGTAAAYPVGENDQLWAIAHPFTAAFSQLLTPLYQAGILRGLGDDLSAKAIRIMPTNFGLDLVVGGATGNPGTITVYGFADTPIVGKVLTYDTIKVDGAVNAGWSSAASIATVNSSGVVTPVGVGHCLLRIMTDDGAVGVVDVNVTGAGPTVSDAFNRADSATSLGNTDTGQAWTALGGTWGIASNQAYYVTGSSANNIYAVVDSGKADTTVQWTNTVYDATGGPRLTFRAVDLNNLWLVDIAGGILYKRVAGAYTSAGTFTHTPVSGDVWSVVLLGSSITVKVNGTTMLTVTDAFQATATKHGLGQFQIGAGTNRYDSFSVL